MYRKKSANTIFLYLRIWLWPVCPFDIDDNLDNSDSDNDISNIWNKSNDSNIITR